LFYLATSPIMDYPLWRFAMISSRVASNPRRIRRSACSEKVREGLVYFIGHPRGAGKNEKPARIEHAPKIGSEAWRVC
jgi:hypothetical protein